MKKIMILAAAAALVLSAACTKTEISSPNDEQHAIGFTNYAPRSVSKADADNYAASSTLINNATFGVYAWSVANNEAKGDRNFHTNGSGDPNFMNPVVVTYKGDTGSGASNTYSPLRYWPSGDKPDGLTFFAYYPQNKGTVAPTFSKTAGENLVSTFTDFTVNANANGQVDFLVADLVPNQYYGETTGGASYKGTVKFTFRHQLTKVIFKFNTDATHADTEIKITGATLSGIKNKGTLVATSTASATTSAWESQDGAVGFTINHPTAALTTSAEPGTSIALDNAKDVFLMVPQDIENGVQKLTITWTVATTGSATITNTKTINLYDITKDGLAHTAENAINWAMNNQVIYTITVGPQPIYFTGTVEAWGTTVNGQISVN